jgi:hypothetical protein
MFMLPTSLRYCRSGSFCRLFFAKNQCLQKIYGDHAASPSDYNGWFARKMREFELNFKKHLALKQAKALFRHMTTSGAKIITYSLPLTFYKMKIEVQLRRAALHGMAADWRKHCWKPEDTTS